MKLPYPYLTQFTAPYAPPDPDHSGNEHLRDSTTYDLLWYLHWGYLDACWAHWVATDPDAGRLMALHPHLRHKPSIAGPGGVFPYDWCTLATDGTINKWGIGTHHEFDPDVEDVVIDTDRRDTSRLARLLRSLKPAA